LYLFSYLFVLQRGDLPPHVGPTGGNPCPPASPILFEHHSQMRVPHGFRMQASSLPVWGSGSFARRLLLSLLFGSVLVTVLAFVTVKFFVSVSFLVFRPPPTLISFFPPRSPSSGSSFFDQLSSVRIRWSESPPSEREVRDIFPPLQQIVCVSSSNHSGNLKIFDLGGILY